MAVSSFCRSCGSHFRITNGVAESQPGVRVSGVVPIVRDEPPVSAPKPTPDIPKNLSTPLGAESAELEKPMTAGRGVGQTWMDQAREKRKEEKLETFAKKTKGKKGRRGKAGKRAARKKQQEPASSEPEVEPRISKPVIEQTELALKEETSSKVPVSDETPTEVRLGKQSQPVETLKQGSMSAMFGGVIDRLAGAVGSGAATHPKMPPTFVPASAAKKSGPEKRPVRCFECNHQQMVSIAASSTQCARCSIYISLEDHDISGVWSQNIRTRGNVRVGKKGSVVGCDIACHDLEVLGPISASVDCSGNAIFRHSGRVMGSMHCRTLVVEKKSEVVFPQGVLAESVDVYGTVVGNITCAGTIRIWKSGKVEGDATARGVDLKDGGVLSGRMSIQPLIDITLPEKKGYQKNF